jgi:hypothetical protein
MAMGHLHAYWDERTGRRPRAQHPAAPADRIAAFAGR